MSYRMYLVRSLGTLEHVWRLRGLHTGGSGSQTGSGQTYLSPRVLGFQVGDRRAGPRIRGYLRWRGELVGVRHLLEMAATPLATIIRASGPTPPYGKP